MKATPPKETPEPVPVHLRSVELMLDKYRRSNPPHKRKRLEVACLIHATGVEKAARELEEMAATLREGGIGFVGHGGGYYISITYASCKRRNPAYPI